MGVAERSQKGGVSCFLLPLSKSVVGKDVLYDKKTADLIVRGCREGSGYVGTSG